MSFLNDLHKVALRKAPPTKESDLKQRLKLDPLTEACKMRIQQITTNVFVSAREPANSLDQLMQHDIRHIVLAAKALTPLFPPDKIEYLKLELVDHADEDILQHFRIACPWIAHRAVELGHNVLVHCESGMSRSVSIIAAYLIWKERLSAAAALDVIGKVWPIAAPNPGFRKQLDVWEAEVRSSNSVVAAGPQLEANPNGGMAERKNAPQ